MKILHDKGHYVIAIRDDNNYVIWDKRTVTANKDGTIQRKYLYFSHLDHAVKEKARLVANDNCVDLQDWLRIFRATAEGILGAFGVE